MDERAKKHIFRLASSGRDIIVCSVDDEGFPNAKTMFRTRNEGLRTFWFSTNTSAIRTGQWLARPEACVYFVDHLRFHGLMLTGRMQVLTGDETKAAFWRRGDGQYYPLGKTDPDYCILRFDAIKGNYYHMNQKILFRVDEIDGEFGRTPAKV